MILYFLACALAALVIVMGYMTKPSAKEVAHMDPILVAGNQITAVILVCTGFIILAMVLLD